MAADALLKEFSVYLDLKRPTSNREFEVVEGDTANRIAIFLTDDGTAVNLEERRVLAVFSSSRGTACQDSNAIGGGVSISGNKVTIDLFISSFSAGMVECELQIYSNGTKGEIGEPVYFHLVTSAKFNFTCRRSILNSETLPAVSQFPLLMNLIRDVTAAETARDNAETSRSSAETQRSTILRGSVTASELDDTIANGWYECSGGILLVESPVTGSISERPSSSFNVHQMLISASGRTIKQRDAVFTSSSSTWLAWSELATTPVRGVDYWTGEDIAAIKGYVDDAILGGEW